MVTKNIDASQNVGAGFGSCGTEPVLWSTPRTNRTGAMSFQITDIDNGKTWDTAKFTMWLYSQSGFLIEGPVSVTKHWGVNSPSGQFGIVPASTFRLRTQVTNILKDGFPLQCRWGAWKGTISFIE